MYPVCTGGAGTLFALRYDGTTQWTRSVGPSLTTSPIPTAEGNIIVRLPYGKLKALDKDGIPLWTVDDYGGSFSDVALLPSGDIASCGWGSFVVVTPGGKKTKAKTFDGAGTCVRPSVDPSGAVFLPFQDALRAVSPAGDVAWTFDAPAYELFSASLTGQGLLVMEAGGGNYWAIDRLSGEAVWTKQLSSSVGAGSAVDKHGRIFLVSVSENAKTVAALYPDGDLMWEWGIDDICFGGVSIGGDGILAVGLASGEVNVLENK